MCVDYLQTSTFRPPSRSESPIDEDDSEEDRRLYRDLFGYGDDGEDDYLGSSSEEEDPDV